MVAICDGGILGTVAPNVNYRCTVATDTTNDPPPDNVIQIARSFFSVAQLPVPKPEISAHNGGICGVRHSLDLHIPIEKIYQYNNTDFGNVTLHVYGVVAMNWGDNTRIDHYTTSGGPYPDISISHIWNTKGYYNITATVTWMGVVTIGPYQGHSYTVNVGGLTTQAQLNNFHVWEAQAVIIS